MNTLKFQFIFTLTLFVSAFSSDSIAQKIRINYIDKIKCNRAFCNLNIGFINYGKPEILTINIISAKNKATAIFNDTFVVESGIHQYQRKIILPNNDSLAQIALKDSALTYKIKIRKKNSEILYQTILEQAFMEKSSLEIKHHAIALSIIPGQEYKLNIIRYNIERLKSDTIVIELKKDSILKINDLIHDLFAEQQLLLSLSKNNKEIIRDTAFYSMGKFYKEAGNNLSKINPIETTNIDTGIITQAPVQMRHGEFSISNYSYSTTPHFDDGSQFPNTIVRLTNSMEILSIPLKIEGYYSTSDRVHSSFKDYFNISLDGTALRSKKTAELLKAEKEKINTINTEIDAQKKLKNELMSMKQVLTDYPDYNPNVDSLVTSESAKISKPILQDSLPLHEAEMDSSIYFPHQDFHQIDSLNTYQDSSAIKKLENYIKQLDKIIEKKENLKNKMLSSPELIDRNRFKKESLYQLGSNRLEKTLLRFDNLEIGNFYEYAGEYSIRDVEIKGVNTSLQLSPSIGLNFLSGKVNEVMFGSDVYSTSRNHVTSIGLKHSTKKFISGIRFTSFSENDKETAKASNMIYSGFFKGSLSSFVQYEAELNYNPEEVKNKLNETNLIKNNSASSFKVSASPFRSTSVFAKYDYVGSKYHSDGVYFMQNNTEIYDIGTDLGLFKNKIKTKVAYRYQRRNIDDKSVRNDNKKWLFELRSNWNRFPNIHIIHSPASMELASQLDTSLIKLNVNSFVTIYRVYYQKKIKRTQITSMIMYNNISNSFNEEYNIDQSSVLSSFYLVREQRAISFNLSHLGFYDKIRYASISVQEPFLNKHLCKIQILRYFNNIQEWSAIMPQYLITSSLEFNIKKKYTLGIGSLVTTYDKYEPEFGLTLEARLRW